MLEEADALRRNDPDKAFILGLVIMGYTQKEIAYHTGLSPGEVKRILTGSKSKVLISQLK
jgi:DNA-binding NarL/FixJ family response regulator